MLSLADRAAMAAKNGGKFCAFAFFLYLCSHSHGEKQMMKIVILDGYGADNVRAFAAGHPQNTV